MSPITCEPFEDVNTGAAAVPPWCHQPNVSISFFTKDSGHKSQHFLCLNGEYFQSSRIKKELKVETEHDV